MKIFQSKLQIIIFIILLLVLPLYGAILNCDESKFAMGSGFSIDGCLYNEGFKFFAIPTITFSIIGFWSKDFIPNIISLPLMIIIAYILSSIIINIFKKKDSQTNSYNQETRRERIRRNRSE